jgi:uncharacterized protein (TIGR03067 family)
MVEPRIQLVFVCVLTACALARSGDANEREKLEGTWTFQPAADGDKKTKGPGVRMILKGNTIAFETGKKRTQGAYSVDPSKSPKTMDITMENVKGTIFAIYELDGDTLKLCHHLGAMASTKRPKTFAADKQTVLGILKRTTD